MLQLTVPSINDVVYESGAVSFELDIIDVGRTLATNPELPRETSTTKRNKGILLALCMIEDA